MQSAVPSQPFDVIHFGDIRSEARRLAVDSGLREECVSELHECRPGAFGVVTHE